MEETYTFSRALHLMRYGGKKMRSELWKPKQCELFIDNGVLKQTIDGTTYTAVDLYDKEIMGSWVEVKDEQSTKV